MFFILSKILDYALLPLLWVTCILVYSVLTKNQRRRRIAIIVALVMLFFFGNGFIVTELTYAWQKRAVSIRSMPEYETAVILAGIVPYQEKGLKDRVSTSQGADRLLHPVQLYKLGKIRKILISGGSGTLFGDKTSEASRLKTVLIFCGVKEENIFLEGGSRNTFESSMASKRVLDSMKVKGPVLLVTSASHMRRAEACFKKAGVNTHIFTVDNATSGEFYVDQMIPTEFALSSWPSLLREMVGYLAYKAMGYC